MFGARSRALFSATFLLASAGVAYSQTITVTPAEPSVVVGQTAQYAAQVSGLSHTGVTWYAGGVKGGNSTVGTIDAKGLYRAPSTPPAQDPVSITAVSVARTSISGSAYAYIIKRGPNITAVSPNPLPQGTFNVTITGTGFEKGAEAYDGAVQLVTTVVKSTRLVANGYQVAASSTTFCVKNPGIGLRQLSHGAGDLRRGRALIRSRWYTAPAAAATAPVRWSPSPRTRHRRASRSWIGRARPCRILTRPPPR